MNRLLKQVLIAGVYLAFFGALLWFGYRLIVPEPTCTDGIQNGAEDGVDCGVASCNVLCATPILSLSVASVDILNAGTGFDVLVRIENPNPFYGASRIEYTLTVTDASGATLVTRRGATYGNPAQPHYLLFPLAGIATRPAKAEFTIDDASVQWGALTVQAKGDIQFGVRSEIFTPASTSLQYQASVLNKSKFNFDTVDVMVLVYNDKGVVVSANSTLQRTLVAGESRAFSMEWPFVVPGAVRAEALVTTNVFANDNFIREYGSPDAIQGF